MGVFSGKSYFSDDEWKQITGYFNELDKYAPDRGFKLCYYHHMGTVIQTSEEVDRFLDMTDDRYVSLNFDTGHFYYSDEDPIFLAKKYLFRTKHIHLKDIRQPILDKVKRNNNSFLSSVMQGIFTVPRDGVIDFNSYFKNIIGYQGWMIIEAEQDPTKANPLHLCQNVAKFYQGKN